MSTKEKCEVLSRFGNNEQGKGNSIYVCMKLACI